MSIKASIAAFALALAACFSLPGPVRAAQAGVTLDADGLKNLLYGLGYETADNAGGYVINRDIAGFTFGISFVLSDDKTELGMNVNLGQIKDQSKIPAQAWRDLLDANRDTDPVTFQFNKDTGMLYLHRAIDNRGITPVLMRVEFESFCSTIADKKALWAITQ